MVVEVTKQRVIIKESTVINSDELCVNKCRFILPDCFEGLSVTAVFNGIPVPVADGECYVPALKKGNAVLGVYAYAENGEELKLMYSPSPCTFYVSQGSFCEAVSEEAIPQISQYEQYCKMLEEKYNELEASVEQAEAQRVQTFEESEASRSTVFSSNEVERQAAEELRQATFEVNENMRNATFSGAYTNLLKNIAEENSTTDNPTLFPAHKTDVYYEHGWAYKLMTAEGLECYIFEAKEGDSFNISGYNFSSASSKTAYIAILDSNFGLLQTINGSKYSFCYGVTACPENTAYVVINKAIDGYKPFVTRVDEPAIESVGGNVAVAGKCCSPLYLGTKTLSLYGSVGSSLSHTWNITGYYFNGMYTLEEGKEYVLYVPESTEYVGLGYICNESFVVNTVIGDGNLDKNRRYVFTATEDDKYIALNCYDFNTIQFGENRSSRIKTGANIGKAFFDGNHDMTLEEMGVIDRSLSGKKWVSYGDSLTFGVGVDFVNGEKLWQEYIAERYNLTHIKMGVGYSSLAYKSTNTEKAFCNDERLDALVSEAPDIVTILGGANDYSFNIPVGTEADIESKNIETFKGAYAYIIDKILTAKTDTTIILLGMFCNGMGSYGEGKGDYSLKEYALATKEIAEYFGLPFIDLNECGFNKYNFNTTDGVFSTDGIHPNAEGTKRLAMAVSRWFDTFKGTIY